MNNVYAPRLWRSSKMLCCVGLAIISSGFLYYYIKPIVAMVQENRAMRVKLTGLGLLEEQFSESITPLQKSINLQQVSASETTLNSTLIARDKVIRALQTLYELPREAKRNTLLFIPQSYDAYWNLIRCESAPFVAPAISGFAMIDGLPGRDCQVTGAGYADYSPRSGPQLDSGQIRSDICNRAFSQGFLNVIALEGPAEGALNIQVLCGQRPHS